MYIKFYFRNNIFFKIYFIFTIALFLTNNISENLSLYLIDNSLILSNIDLFNRNYILNNIPFFIETTEDSIN